MAFQIKTLREKVKAHLKRRFLLIIREEVLLKKWRPTG